MVLYTITDFLNYNSFYIHIVYVYIIYIYVCKYTYV